MMGQQSQKESLFYYFRLEDQIPETHLLRLIDRSVDFSFVRDRLTRFYSLTGRPSIDPEVLLRLLLVGYLYGITSERRLLDEVRMHLAYRWFTRLGLAAELVKLKVDIIVAPTAAGALAAQRATRTIPIVTGFVSDPVAVGLIANLARPGGNITGLAVPTSEMAGKRLQLLREVAPTVARIAVLSDPSPLDTDLRETEAAARTLGVQLQVWKVRSGGELDRAFTAIARERAVGIIILPSATLFAYRAHIAQLAVKYRLPTSAWTRDLTEAGSLMSYGANQLDVARRAAYFVDKILKGAQPGDLPVGQPTKFEFVINMKTAKALGLTIPPSLLLRADEVIQ